VLSVYASFLCTYNKSTDVFQCFRISRIVNFSQMVQDAECKLHWPDCRGKCSTCRNISLSFFLRTEGSSPWNFFLPPQDRRYNNTQCSKCIKQFQCFVSVSNTTQWQVLYPIPFAHFTICTTLRASFLMTSCCGSEPNNRAQK